LLARVALKIGQKAGSAVAEKDKHSAPKGEKELEYNTGKV